MKTSRADYARFVASCLDWVEKLGLKSWRLEFQHVLKAGRYALCSYDVGELHAVLTLSTEFPEKATKQQIERLALHECMHLVVAPLHEAALRRNTDAAEINKLDHLIVHTVENLFFGPEAV